MMPFIMPVVGLRNSVNNRPITTDDSTMGKKKAVANAVWNRGLPSKMIAATSDRPTIKIKAPKTKIRLFSSDCQKNLSVSSFSLLRRPTQRRRSKPIPFQRVKLMKTAPMAGMIQNRV